jgi:histidine triad (HIT) family protein
MTQHAYDPENVFAKVLRGELPCIKVFEDEHSLAFMDIMPRADGHTLVIPKRAARTIEDVATADLSRLIGTVQKVAIAARRAMQADGMTIQQFNESAGGQVVFHIHFHIIPRWKGEPLRPHSGEMANPEALGAHAAKIIEALGT